MTQEKEQHPNEQARALSSVEKAALDKEAIERTVESAKGFDQMLEQVKAILPEGSDPRLWILASQIPMTSKSVFDLYAAANDYARTIFRYLPFTKRLSLVSVELMLGSLYSAVVFVYYYINWEKIKAGFLGTAEYLVPYAYAQATTVPVYPVKEMVIAGLAMATLITILMSAYATLLREPPSTAGREILKLTISFATGCLATFLGGK